METIETSCCFDIQKASDKEQEGLIEDEVAVIATNHDNVKIFMILKKDQIQALL